MDNEPKQQAPQEPAKDAGAGVADNSINTNPAPAQAPDMHGFTSEQLADMKKFFDNNGGFDGVKAKISNPEKPVEKPVENSQPGPQKQEEPTSHTEAQPVQQQKPQGRTNDELMAEYYFEKLSKKPEYASISKEIADGVVLKEMANLGIQYKYADGSWNNDRINDYLQLRAKTVPAKPTNSEPNASAAPTVSYTEVGDNGFTDINQAYKVLMEPGNPGAQKAEEYIREYFNGKQPKK